MQITSKRDGTPTLTTIVCADATELAAANDIIRRCAGSAVPVVAGLTVRCHTNKGDAAKIAAAVAARPQQSRPAQPALKAGRAWTTRHLVLANPIAEANYRRAHPTVTLADGTVAVFDGFGRAFIGGEIDGSEFDGAPVRYAYYR